MNTENRDKDLSDALNTLVNLVVFLIAVIVVLAALLLYSYRHSQKDMQITPARTQHYGMNEKSSEDAGTDKTHYWSAPDTNGIAGMPAGKSILYGKELIVHTSLYFGPEGKVLKNGTNGMNCQNCHLEAGTKVFGNNYSAVASTYPKYRARSGAREDMVKRVNDCFERSLNGKPLEADSKEMQAIISYLKWLGKDVARGEKPAGSGLQSLVYLDRAADPVNGKYVYTQKCQSCHQRNGEGLLNSEKNAYTYPPLWGAHSYNNGAGLYRISSFARFVKYNMPLGASHNNVQLTNEEAWDVAAFVNSQPRPVKNIKRDWPKIQEKPFDHPYGPYADSFSEKQHKYGPYQPIIDATVKNK